MNKIFILAKVSFTLILLAGCKDQHMTEYNDVVIAGGHKIPVVKYCNKPPIFNKRLQLNNGYYPDTIEGGAIHKYRLTNAIAWVNSASSFSFVDSHDSAKLCGEGYFETGSKPLTVLIEDTIGFVMSENTKVNIIAYKTPLDPKYITKLASATLHKGKLIVINGKRVDTIESPKNDVCVYTRSETWSTKAWTIEGETSWTQLKFDYKETDINELAERLGRRFNMTVEIMDGTYLPINFKADMNEPLEDIVNRMYSSDSFARCRIINNKIVVASGKANPNKN